jgi:hypothetical protein
MTLSTAIVVGAEPPFIFWNGVADIDLLMAIDELREQVVGAINASLADQPQQPHDPDLDFGARA